MRRRSDLGGLLVAVLVLAACRERGPSAGPAPTADGGTDGRRPPVVLVSIDTLRADRLSAWGYPDGRTPAIDRLAQESLLFESAWSPVPLTLPSHASVLTGVLPDVHGVRSNQGYRLEGGKDVPALAEILRAAGWRTGAAVSAFVLRSETGIDRGFEHWDDRMVERTGHGLGGLQRSGAGSLEAALVWLDSLGADESPFLLLHLYEPHAPWGDDAELAAAIPDLYDADVALADRVVGELRSALEERGLWDPALVVLLSDHGEGLGDHGELEHGVLLYREALHVPLLLKLPDGARAGERVEHPVALHDVAPTILEAVGLEVPEAMEGRSLLAELEPERAVLSETFYPRLHYGWSELLSAVSGRFHLILGPEPELFDMEDDPGETRNVLAEHRGVVVRLRRELEARDPDFEAPGAVDPDTRRRLAALGYAGSTGGGDDAGERPDPRSKVDVLRRLGEAGGLIAAGRDAEAARLLQEVLRDEPGLVDARTRLADCLARTGRVDEAIGEYRETLRRSPSSASTVAPSLAVLLLEAGRLDDAADHARLALDSSPGRAHDLLARVAFERGELAVAEEHARAAVDADPSRPPFQLGLARVLVARGRSSEALGHARRAAADLGAVEATDPERIRGLFFLLGRLEAEAGSAVEAEAALRRHVELFPDSLAGWSELAVLVAAAGRPTEVGPLLQRMVAANPTPAAYAKAVETLRVLGDARSADGLLEHARRLFPRAPELVAGEPAGLPR